MRPIGHAHMPGSLLKIITCNILFNSHKNPVWHVVSIIICILHMRLLKLESLSFLYARSHSSGKTEVGVQFSGSVVSDSLWPHGQPHNRPSCPSPTPIAYLNSYPLSRWCHPTISTSVIPFSSPLQYFPASGSFPMNQLFTSGGQSIRASASVSVLPMNT